MKKLIIVSSLALLIGAAIPQNAYSAAAAGAGASTVSDDISEVRLLLFDLYKHRNSVPTDSIKEFRLELIDEIEARLKAKGASITASGAYMHYSVGVAMAQFNTLPSPAQTYDRKMMMKEDAEKRAVQDWLQFTKPRKPVLIVLPK